MLPLSGNPARRETETAKDRRKACESRVLALSRRADSLAHLRAARLSRWAISGGAQQVFGDSAQVAESGRGWLWLGNVL